MRFRWARWEASSSPLAAPDRHGGGRRRRSAGTVVSGGDVCRPDAAHSAAAAAARARETRTRTATCSPAAIENEARPRGRRRTLSLVVPAQRPTVAAGQLSLSVMDLAPKDSLLDTSATPAKAGVAAGAAVVAGLAAVVSASSAGPVTAAGATTNSSAPMSVVPIERGSPSRSNAPLSGSSTPAPIVADPRRLAVVGGERRGRALVAAAVDVVRVRAGCPVVRPVRVTGGDRRRGSAAVGAHREAGAARAALGDHVDEFDRRLGRRTVRGGLDRHATVARRHRSDVAEVAGAVGVQMALAPAPWAIAMLLRTVLSANCVVHIDAEEPFTRPGRRSHRTRTRRTSRASPE